MFFWSINFKPGLTKGETISKRPETKDCFGFFSNFSEENHHSGVSFEHFFNLLENKFSNKMLFFRHLYNFFSHRSGFDCTEGIGFLNPSN